MGQNSRLKCISATNRSRICQSFLDLMTLGVTEFHSQSCIILRMHNRVIRTYYLTINFSSLSTILRYFG